MTIGSRFDTCLISSGSLMPQYRESLLDFRNMEKCHRRCDLKFEKSSWLRGRYVVDRGLRILLFRRADNRNGYCSLMVM